MANVFRELNASGKICKSIGQTIRFPKAYTKMASSRWITKQSRFFHDINESPHHSINGIGKLYLHGKSILRWSHALACLSNRLRTWQSRTIKTLPGNIRGPNDKEIENYLKRWRIPYKNGYTSIVAPCQACKSLDFDENTKTDNKNWSLFINKTTGRFICKKCGTSGAWHEIKACQVMDGAKVIEKEINQPSLNAKAVKQKSSTEDAFTIFEGAKCLSNIDQSEMEMIQNKFKTQSLSLDTLKKYNIRMTSYKFLESDGSSKPLKCLVIPWYDITSQTVAAVKLSPLESDMTSKFIPRKFVGSLFGSKQSTKPSKEIVITSSEFDAMAVDQATSYNAVALPAGISVLPLEALPQLEQFEKVILWLGNDSRSKQAVNQFSKKLNMERCSFVRLLEEDSPNGALEALNKGYNLKSIIAKGPSLSHKEILTFNQLREDVFGEFLNADEAAGVKWKRFPGLTSILKGHRPGELSILTGQTGTGKTTLLSELSLDLCSQGVSTLWGSFEIKNVRLVKAMLCQYSGLNLESAIGQYNFWADKFDALPLYFMSYFGAQSINTVLETMSHAAYVYDIEHVIIDNLQFMMSTSNASFSDRFSTMDLAISALRNFASSTNVHVTLVIHPRKENQDAELQTASIFGTAKASQEADNIIILQDAPGRSSRRYLQVTKNRFDGAIGKAPLQFNRDSLCMSGFHRDLKTGSSKFTVGSSQDDIPAFPDLFPYVEEVLSNEMFGDMDMESETESIGRFDCCCSEQCRSYDSSSDWSYPSSPRSFGMSTISRSDSILSFPTQPIQSLQNDVRRKKCLSDFAPYSFPSNILKQQNNIEMETDSMAPFTIAAAIKSDPDSGHVTEGSPDRITPSPTTTEDEGEASDCSCNFRPCSDEIKVEVEENFREIARKRRRLNSVSSDSDQSEDFTKDTSSKKKSGKSKNRTDSDGKNGGFKPKQLYQFLMDLLRDEDFCPQYIEWVSRDEKVFRLVDSAAVARMWGECKNRENMTYEKMSRALRYYYENGILERVPNCRLHYRFGKAAYEEYASTW